MKKPDQHIRLGMMLRLLRGMFNIQALYRLSEAVDRRLAELGEIPR